MHSSLRYEKTVLVPGGAGFIGSSFINRNVLAYPNYFFVVVDKLTYATFNSTKNIQVGSQPNYAFIKLDITDSASLLQVFNQYSITDVINFAAETSVDRSFLYPLEFTQTNVTGTQTLLECIRQYPSIKLLHISTDEVYGDEQDDAVEESPLNPTNPYSASKAAADCIIHSYVKSYNLDVIIIRPNNIYGPNQHPEKLIPKTVKSLIEGSNIQVHGTGKNSRCYLHISDFLSALDIIWLTKHGHKIINVGHNNQAETLWIIGMICKIFGTNKSNLERVQDRVYNDSHYLINCDIIRDLGWRPNVNIRDGLSEVIEMERLKIQLYHSSNS